MVKGKIMPVQSVSLNNIAFRGEAPKAETAVAEKAETASKTESKTPENKHIDGKKIGIVLGGLAAAGIAAVLIGKSKKVPSELSIEEFKKIGKFNKGFATAKNKPFSGIINVANANGKYALEYDKGVLKESVQFKNMAFPEFGQKEEQLTAVSKKVYSNGEDGNKVECFLRNPFYKICGGEEWGRLGSSTVSADKTSVVKEYTDLSSGEVFRDAISKQKNGSWIKTS